MNATSIRVIGLFTVLASSFAAGCKEDPPPPPPVPTAATSTAANPATAANAPVPRMSPEATKLYRVDMCFFGAQGLRYLGEAYTESLGGKAPSATNLPEFGDYPEPQAMPRRDRRGRRGAEKDAPGADAAEGAKPDTQDAKPDAQDAKPDAGRKRDRAGRGMRGPGGPVRQVPFLKYLRYCAVAKQLKQPAHEELDAALMAFDQYAAPLNRSLVEATRYFGTKQFERDEFKRGTALHEKLSEGLPKASEELDKLEKAVTSFKKSVESLPDELDEGGKIGQRAYDEARSATMLFLAGEVDTEAAQAALEKLKKTHEELVAEGEKNDDAPYPKVVGPKIEVLISAIEGALEGGASPSTQQRHGVFMAMADLVESTQRALAQLLNRRGGHPSIAPPARMMKPRLRPGQIPPQLDRAKPPAAADEPSPQ